jgi:hypothetical protein
LLPFFSSVRENQEQQLELALELPVVPDLLEPHLIIHTLPLPNTHPTIIITMKKPLLTQLDTELLELLRQLQHKQVMAMEMVMVTVMDMDTVTEVEVTERQAQPQRLHMVLPAKE